MKKYPKIVQVDKRGQIVIPKEIRDELSIDETTGFFVYSITDEGILLKKIKPEELSNDDPVVKELKEKSSKISVKQKNIEKSIIDYKKTKEGSLDLI
ncbi:MAG: AbrB/MazE/SpoVT family DNA-binding domain-containing protein [archaeon]